MHQIIPVFGPEQNFRGATDAKPGQVLQRFAPPTTSEDVAEAAKAYL